MPPVCVPTYLCLMVTVVACAVQSDVATRGRNAKLPNSLHRRAVPANRALPCAGHVVYLSGGGRSQTRAKTSRVNRALNFRTRSTLPPPRRQEHQQLLFPTPHAQPPPFPPAFLANCARRVCATLILFLLPNSQCCRSRCLQVFPRLLQVSRPASWTSATTSPTGQALDSRRLLHAHRPLLLNCSDCIPLLSPRISPRWRVRQRLITYRRNDLSKRTLMVSQQRGGN